MSSSTLELLENYAHKLGLNFNKQGLSPDTLRANTYTHEAFLTYAQQVFPPNTEPKIAFGNIQYDPSHQIIALDIVIDHDALPPDPQLNSLATIFCLVHEVAEAGLITPNSSIAQAIPLVLARIEPEMTRAQELLPTFKPDDHAWGLIVEALAVAVQATPEEAQLIHNHNSQQLSRRPQEIQVRGSLLGTFLHNLGKI